MDYKYTTTFQSPLLACDINESSLISIASLENLAPLLPTNIDYKSNVDLLGVAFNAALVNKFNRNGDGMDTATALKYTKNFVHKPTNIEHDKQKVVGHIAAAGFSEFGSSRILASDEVQTMSEPFNIALGAVLYKSVNPNFTQLIEKSLDPNDSAYQKVSASWEVGFNDYVLAIGSSNLEESKIVSDPREIEELRGFLRSNGGSGKTDDGQEIYRLIQGNIFPLGIAYTLNPAADVKGLYSESEPKSTIFINDKRDKISQNNKLNVNNEKDINAMELENTISELKELLNEKKFSKEAVANMTDTFAEAIRQRDEQYRQDIEAEKNQKEAVSAEYDALKATVSDLEEKLGQANDRISVFENDRRAEEAVARFNDRMDEFASFLPQSLRKLEKKRFMPLLLLNWKFFGNTRTRRLRLHLMMRFRNALTKKSPSASATLLLKKSSLKKLLILRKKATLPCQMLTSLLHRNLLLYEISLRLHFQGTISKFLN